MHNEVLDELVVVKRSGQRVEFNASKIAVAIKKAFDSTANSSEEMVFKTFEKVLSYINDNYKDRKTINVEDIQDIIENMLYNQKYFDVYNSFKEYREKRALSRKVFSEKQQHKFLKAIEKFEQNDYEKFNLSTPYELLYKFGKIIHNEYTKAYIMDTKSVRAQEDGNIFIHNIDYFSLGVLSNTHLKLNNIKDVDSIIYNIIESKKEINGEIGINGIDKLLKPFILKEYKKVLKDLLKKYFKLFGFYELMNIKKIEELIEKENSLEFNLEKYDAFIFNDTIRKVFISVYDDSKKYILEFIENSILKILKSLEFSTNSNVKYTLSFGSDLSSLGKLINEKILKIICENKFEKINFIIKIIKKDDYFLRAIPIFLENNKKIFVQMIDNDSLEYFADGFKIYENVNSSEFASNGRMIVSASSINFARLGLKYQDKSKMEFYAELDNVCELVKNQLCLAFETLGDKLKDNYEILFNGNILDDEKLDLGQKIRKVIKNGVLSIGIIGLKECVCLLEKEKINQIKLIKEILNYLNSKCDNFSIETKLNFGIFESNDKISRNSLLRTDKAIYGNVEGITDKRYYDLIEYDYLNDYKELSNISSLFRYGKLVTFNLSNKYSNKKIHDIIKISKENGLDFIKIVVGKDEY